jgi:hypothetical protein
MGTMKACGSKFKLSVIKLCVLDSFTKKPGESVMLQSGGADVAALPAVIGQPGMIDITVSPPPHDFMILYL